MILKEAIISYFLCPKDFATKRKVGWECSFSKRN